MSGAKGSLTLSPRIARYRTGFLVTSVATSLADPSTFLFFGRIESYKGLEFFLEAGTLLVKRGFKPRLIVAGTGSDLARHRARISRMPWVELVDRRIDADEIPDLFARSSAVVLPYTDATQSGVVAMAFGFGRPAISTNVGGLPDVICDGYNGLLVPEGRRGIGRGNVAGDHEQSSAREVDFRGKRIRRNRIELGFGRSTNLRSV